jgi:PPOX class probable F420-dependent enzyme
MTKPAAHAVGGSPSFVATLADSWAVRLTTYRRDGTPVSTPVNLVTEGDHAFFRTYEESGKFKRLRNDPRVTIAPSDRNGIATGAAVRGTVELLHGPEDARVGRLIDAKHRIFQGFLVRTAHRLRRYTTRHFIFRPDVEATSGPAG